MLDDIILEPEQEELLSILVEASRNVSSSQRESFYFSGTMSGSSLSHSGLPSSVSPHGGDLENLAQIGFILVNRRSSGFLRFDVTPTGFKYYDRLKERRSPPAARLETDIRNYLDSTAFQERYPQAYDRWVEAEKRFRDTNADQHLTVIGHLCREAMQEFADALIRLYKPPQFDLDKTKDINRVRAVLDLKKAQLGGKEEAFLDALLAYWRAVSGLVQRQEHGGQKEGELLTWEDGRRVVFQTAIVMFEIDRVLNR